VRECVRATIARATHLRLLDGSCLVLGSTDRLRLRLALVRGDEGSRLNDGDDGALERLPRWKLRAMAIVSDAASACAPLAATYC